jgi:hypothetical protein
LNRQVSLNDLTLQFNSFYDSGKAKLDWTAILHATMTIDLTETLLIDLELCALKLSQLDCSYNGLVRLPLNLREMVSLIDLNVENNPLEVPSAAVS